MNMAIFKDVTLVTKVMISCTLVEENSTLSTSTEVQAKTQSMVGGMLDKMVISMLEAK